MDFKAHRHIYRHGKKHHIRWWIISLVVITLLMLLLPWTQHIRSKGTVTALKQEQRPQQVNSILAGRIEKWHVSEGDYVKKGDTILLLSEVKPDYLDPKLLDRTKEQLAAKQQSINYYQHKVSATETQIGALHSAREAKLGQLKNKYRQAEVKVLSDSMDMVAAVNELKIAALQYNRQRSLHDSGLVSLTQLEHRNQLYQNAMAKKISAENKYYAAKQELGILNIEFSAIEQEYAEKLSKAESDRYGSLSTVAAGHGEVSKLENQYASYIIRNGMYYVIAPQDGQIVKAIKSGIGEIVKEGELLVHVVPDKVDYAVEMYVRPVDLPLVARGQKVRFQFDGFPAIVFSGWPEASYGTYSGIVSSVENNVSANGKYRVLVMEDKSYRPWPKELKMGTGANGIALLKNVPVYYEIWRNINSFPPDYYTPKNGVAQK